MCRSHRRAHRARPPRFAPDLVVGAWGVRDRRGAPDTLRAVERDFLSVGDLTPDELLGLLDLAAKVKAQPEDYADRLRGRAVAMLFEKPSTRTRGFLRDGHRLGRGSLAPALRSSCSSDAGRRSRTPAASSHGTSTPSCSARSSRSGSRCSLAPSTVPVVNALSDFEHPCQCPGRPAHGARGGKAILRAARSFTSATATTSRTRSCSACAMTGMHVRVATPPGFEPIPQIVHRAAEIASGDGGERHLAHGSPRGLDRCRHPVHGRVGQQWARKPKRADAPWSSPRTRLTGARSSSQSLT